MYIYATIFLDFVRELQVGVKFSKLDFLEDLYPIETIISFSGIWFFYLARFAQERAGSYCGWKLIGDSSLPIPEISLRVFLQTPISNLHFSLVGSCWIAYPH